VTEPADSWRRIDALTQAALGLPDGDREAFLEASCNDSNEREEARALLIFASRAEHFLELPVAAAAAALPPLSESLTGARVGIFEVVALLGSGGMGEVYRARDTRLNRDVALKILPMTFALDPERLHRFRIEAQALASLNHPNIAAIYGAEESAGVYALVLELIDGQTLAERLAAGPIPLVDTVSIGRQMAEGLEAAHERGIVHNDFTPYNVKVCADGRVKVLDFGLATVMRIASDATGGAAPSDTSRAAFGTPGYASPEQLDGRGDKRNDVWAFGAVLFEILSGQPAFAERDAAANPDPDWSALPPSTPPALRHLIGRCLERDPRRRLRDIGEARIVLEDPALLAALVATEAQVRTGRGVRRRWPPSRAMALVASAALMVGVAAWLSLSRRDPSEVVRLSITLPEGESLSTGDRSVAAISPNGKNIVYVAAPGGLYLRPLSASDASAIPGVEEYGNVGEPVFSPDGQSIVFHVLDDQTLKRIPVSGGTAVTICRAVFPHGVSWSQEGIVFVEPGHGIVRVDPRDGQPHVIVPLGGDHMTQSPQLLAGGESLLYTVTTGTTPDRWDRGRVVLRHLSSGEDVTVLEGGSDARYVATGHLVYAVGGNLFAVRFNLQDRRVEGAAVPLVHGVRRGAPALTGSAQFDIAGSTLMYLAGAPSTKWDLALTNRAGVAERLPLPSSTYEAPRVSPDGRRIAFDTDDGKEAIVWIYDLDGAQPPRRFTFGGNARFPVWSRDGTRVAFQSDRDGHAALYWQSLDGAPAERLTSPASGEAHEPETWSPTSDELVYSSTIGGDTTLWTLSLHTRTASRFSDVRSSTRTGAVFSPDGRWLAYASSDALGKTIYVEPFPATGMKHQLAVPGGRQPNHPLWSPDGKQIFYNPGPGRFEAVPVTTAPAVAFGNPVLLPRFFPGAATQTRRPFDVLPDGRFVAPMAAGVAAVRRGQDIRIVLNWFHALVDTNR
jgi:eukaryotic-like serine/threonine-protein kinase